MFNHIGLHYFYENVFQVPAIKSDEQINPSEKVRASQSKQQRFQINIELDVIASTLFIAAVATRFYKLEQPRNIVYVEYFVFLLNGEVQYY